MFRRQYILPFALITTLLTAPSSPAQSDEGQSWKGYVTGGSSLASFDVNGLHVIVSPATLVCRKTNGNTVVEHPASAVPYLGEPAEIRGKIDKKKHSVLATKVILQELQPREVDGEGVIETVTSPVSTANTSPDDRLVRVDGYLVLVSAKTAKNARPPMTATLPIEPNMWMNFHGHQGLDGIVVADKLAIDDNGISKREEKLLKKSDYDPGAVDKDSKQGTLSKVFRGIDPKKIPPYDDPVMQARVETIGNKLVPQYQKDLPQDDEKKIDFQFQVIDLNKWRRDAHTLPNGIILVPRQVVERMQNDAQLATVLADNIACALEKQDYRAQPGNNARGAVSIAGAAAGLFIPGISLLTDGGASIAAAKAIRITEEQSGRVSLFLLHDAGYNIDQAPLAWWLLASKNKKGASDISLPRRAAYLYETIAYTWHQSSTLSTPTTLTP